MELTEKLDRVNWTAAETSLWEYGYARLGTLLTPQECTSLIELYPRDDLFRSRIDMARYRFGVGDYKYFADPLPALVDTLRRKAYPPLAGIANRWMEALNDDTRYPPDWEALHEQCRARG